MEERKADEKITKQAEDIQNQLIQGFSKKITEKQTRCVMCFMKNEKKNAYPTISIIGKKTYHRDFIHFSVRIELYGTV